MVVMLVPSVSRTGIKPAACLFARVEADSQTRAVTGYWLALDSSIRLVDDPCIVPPAIVFLLAGYFPWWGLPTGRLAKLGDMWGLVVQ
jgi:hypothetical protein